MTSKPLEDRACVFHSKRDALSAGGLDSGGPGRYHQASYRYKDPATRARPGMYRGSVCSYTMALKDEAGVGHGGVPRPEVGGKKRRGLATR